MLGGGRVGDALLQQTHGIFDLEGLGESWLGGSSDGPGGEKGVWVCGGREASGRQTREAVVAGKPGGRGMSSALHPGRLTRIHTPTRDPPTPLPLPPPRIGTDTHP
jgi:hypothetical protein